MIMQRDQPADVSAGNSFARVVLANAPVSYGAFEITVGVDPNVPDPVTLLDWVSSAGYAGIDLGPVGYLGTTETLAARLAQRELALAGGYLELPFSEPGELRRALSALDRLLDIFDSANGTPPPRPTLADAGSPVRSRYPGRAAIDPSVGLDPAGWSRFADGVASPMESHARLVAAGSAGTNRRSTTTRPRTSRRSGRSNACSRSATSGSVSTPGTCCLGGASRSGQFTTGRNGSTRCTSRTQGCPGCRRSSRRRRPSRRSGAARPSVPWATATSTSMKVLDALGGIGYAGWLVVEQDVLSDPNNPRQPALEQRRNREFLRAHGL